MKQSATFLLSALALSTACLAQSAPDRTHRVALVVGNAAYTNQPRLCNPLNDARRVSKTLKNMGFDVEVVENADLKSMQAAVRRFAQKIMPGDLAFYYFSGHGVQAEAVNYLIPVDYAGTMVEDLKDSAYPADRVQQLMEGRGAAIRILVFDACSNNPYTGAKGASRGLNQMNGSEGTLIAFAASPGKTADDRCESPNGRYTGALLNYLEDKRLTIAQVFEKTRVQVYTESQKVHMPWTSNGFIDNGTSFWPDAVAGSTEPRERPTTESKFTMQEDILLWNQVKEGCDLGLIREYQTRFPTGVFIASSRQLKARCEALKSPLDSTGAEVILRIAGSNTIGAVAGPGVALEFLRSLGATKLQIIPGVTDEVEVAGELLGRKVIIAIKAHGSGTGFQCLANNTCDIAMSSRKVTNADAQKGALARERDMSSPRNEHVIGLDGISVIVNRRNTIASLTLAQLRRIYSGEIHDWYELGDRRHHPIVLFARDENSGTYHMFRDLVMEGAKLPENVHRLEDNRQLSNMVAFDEDAIGFVGLPYIDPARAVAIGNGLAEPLLPGKPVVATKDYVLSRELFLYVTSNENTPYIAKFIEFAKSSRGQDVMDTAGFAGKNISFRASSKSVRNPFERPRPAGKYGRYVAGAEPLNLSFRFRSNGSTLMNESMDDLQRLQDQLRNMPRGQFQLLLIGHADGDGSDEVNDRLSLERAQNLAAEFRGTGVNMQVQGFGKRYPIADNGTANGKQLNRRVEVWVRELR